MPEKGHSVASLRPLLIVSISLLIVYISLPYYRALLKFVTQLSLTTKSTIEFSKYILSVYPQKILWRIKC